MPFEHSISAVTSRGVALLLVCLVLGQVSRSARAEPEGQPNVPAMTQASDLIVVGHAMHAKWQGTPQDRRETFEIAVGRVLKGESASRVLPLGVSLDASEASRGVGDGRYGVFFLRRGPAGLYAATDPRHPVLGTLPAAAGYVSVIPGDPLAGVAEELAHVFATPATVLAGAASWLPEIVEIPSGHPGLFEEPGPPRRVVVTDTRRAELVYLRTYEATESIPLDVLAGPLTAIVRGAGEMLGRVWAAADLIGHGDIEYLDDVKDYVLRPWREADATIAILSLAIKQNPPTADDLPRLEPLLSSPSIEIRRAAVYSLSQAASPVVIKDLVTLALADPDREIRFYAVQGICNLADICNGPSIGVFMDAGERQKYATLIRDWVNNGMKPQ
jgi:hypothetical protein